MRLWCLVQVWLYDNWIIYFSFISDQNAGLLVPQHQEEVISVPLLLVHAIRVCNFFKFLCHHHTYLLSFVDLYRRYPMPINPNNSGIEIVQNDFTPWCLKLNIFLSLVVHNGLTIFLNFIQELQNSFVFTVKMTKEQK